MSNQLPKDLRQNLLAKIHIGKKQLGMFDDEYRELLRGLTGKESAKELEAGELKRVVEAMYGMGFRVSNGQKAGGRGQKGKKLSPQTREKPKAEKTQVDKIRALWIEGYQVGVVRNRYESGLNGFVKRMFKVERVEWLSVEQAQKCIEAIKAMVERGKIPPTPLKKGDTEQGTGHIEQGSGNDGAE